MSTNNAINGKSGNIAIGIAEGAPDDNTIISTNTNGNIVFDPNGTGWVEIDFSGSKTGLQFNNQLQNRVITLYESTNNAHQYHGFGVNAAALRYQVGETTSDHVFYAGASSSSSNELIRIKGTGEVGIGISTPHAPLQFSNGVVNRKIVLYENANNDHQFLGFGVNTSGKELRYQIDRNLSDGGHVFYTGASSSASTELFRIVGTGDVVVNSGTFWPSRLPSGGMYLSSPSATTITTSGTDYKANGSTTSFALNEFTMPTDNKLQYTGTPTIFANINVNTVLSQNQVVGSDPRLTIYKNGSAITGSRSYGHLLLASDLRTVCTNYIVSMSTNDYIELYLSGSVNGQTVTIQYMQVSISAT